MGAHPRCVQPRLSATYLAPDVAARDPREHTPSQIAESPTADAVPPRRKSLGTSRPCGTCSDEPALVK
jgi:hypothetical protein